MPTLTPTPAVTPDPYDTLDEYDPSDEYELVPVCSECTSPELVAVTPDTLVCNACHLVQDSSPSAPLASSF